MSVEVDIAIVGGGSAGLGAATAARRKGASVALIERAELGGDCTWRGCVPSKALIERAHEVHAGRRRGLTGDVDFGQVMREVHQAMEEIGRDESRETLEAGGIRVLQGEASFAGPRRLSVDGTTVTAIHMIVATGAAPVIPPVEGLREIDPLTNDTVFGLTVLPRRLAVMGGGPIGLELAQAFQRLGSKVTVFEGLPRLASKEEPEASETIARVLTNEGARVVVGSNVERVETVDGVSTLTTGAGESAEADQVLVAVGRRPVTDGLGLDRVGVELDDRGYVKVDDKLRTTAEGVWAIGDITGGLQFTHAGYEMGAVAVGNALGRFSQAYSTKTLPWATFTDPEIGRVGLTEAEAAGEHGDQARVAYLPMADTDRARATGRTDGFVKLIVGPRGPLGRLGGGALIGATVMCPGGGDIVHEVAVLMRAGAFAGRLAQTVHAYPSWAMAVRECAAQFFFRHRGREAAQPGCNTGSALRASSIKGPWSYCMPHEP